MATHGTFHIITPVKRIENYHLSASRPVTDKLKEQLTAITENRNDKYQDWVYSINLENS